MSVISDYPFQRYDLVPPCSGMEQRADGDWVKLMDVLKLHAEIACLKAELGELREELKEAYRGGMPTLNEEGEQQTL